ncbi:SLC24A2 [Symbiodinium sp. CCMP2592]|nr:SLC24A2 [Symbiodinium sp. CCMP2592]
MEEALSSHLYRLQISHDLLESRVRVAEDRLDWLDRSEGLEQVCAKMAKFKHTSWEVMINEERNLAVNKWLSLVMVEPLTFGVARNFYAGKASGISSGSLADSISDCLAAKATSTINARANCLLRFVSWAKGNMPFVFPLTEHAVYAYFEEKKSTAAATSFRSLLSSVAFAQHVVGLEGCDKVYTSGRVRGLASKLYMQKRKLKQRNPLRVSDVILLERICCKLEDRSLQDRIAAGFFLFLIYARARYSDGQNVASLTDSPLYLECSVGRSKTSFTLERKTRYLPMAARKVGIKCAWADAWLEALAEAGLAIKQNDPLLPCPSSNGSWKMIPLPCDQACSWLRSLLGNAQSDPYLANVGTHSPKRTLLSWASKRGLPREQRALLGYHTSRASGAGSELIYESDAQSAPLRTLSSMIDEVSSGAFKPDKPRGQQLASELSANADPPGDEIESSDSEGSEDEEEIDHSGDEACVAEALNWHGKVDLDKIDPSCVFFRHRQSRVVHITADEAGANLGCGRAISGQYRKLEEQSPPAAAFSSKWSKQLTMAAFSESGPVFKSRCAQVGLASADVEKLEKVGVNSLAKFAFMTSYTPGSGDDKDLIAAFESALGTPPSVGQKSSFRRLFHEAYAVTTSEMKMLVERTDESIPRKLSVPERSERFEVVSKRLVGLSIKNRLEPADSLVDSFVSQYEQDKLQFVPWEKLVSKEQEASTGAKREPFFSLDSTGKLRSETKVEVRADTSTELLLQLALQRRGIAMEMANILDYHHHHMWVERLLAARLDAPPSTHMQPTLDQCQQADRKLWQLLGEATRSGIQLKAGGRPLDAIFEATWQTPEVLQYFICSSRCLGQQALRSHSRWHHRRDRTGQARTIVQAKAERALEKVPRAPKVAGKSLPLCQAADPAPMLVKTYVLGMDSKRAGKLPTAVPTDDPPSEHVLILEEIGTGQLEGHSSESTLFSATMAPCGSETPPDAPQPPAASASARSCNPVEHLFHGLDSAVHAPLQQLLDQLDLFMWYSSQEDDPTTAQEWPTILSQLNDNLNQAICFVALEDVIAAVRYRAETHMSTNRLDMALSRFAEYFLLRGHAGQPMALPHMLQSSMYSVCDFGKAVQQPQPAGSRSAYAMQLYSYASSVPSQRKLKKTSYATKAVQVGKCGLKAQSKARPRRLDTNATENPEEAPAPGPKDTRAEHDDLRRQAADAVLTSAPWKRRQKARAGAREPAKDGVSEGSARTTTTSANPVASMTPLPTTTTSRQGEATGKNAAASSTPSKPLSKVPYTAAGADPQEEIMELRFDQLQEMQSLYMVLLMYWWTFAGIVPARRSYTDNAKNKDQPVDAIMHPMHIDAILRHGSQELFPGTRLGSRPHVRSFADIPLGLHFVLPFIYGVLIGVRQGCMLAPCLWLLFVTYLFHHLDTTMGGADSWTCQHSTAFADDLHFKWDLDDPKALDRMKMEVATVLSVLKSFGLQISAEKSTMLIEIRGTAADVWLSKNVYKDAENNKHFRYDTFAKLSIPLGTQFKLPYTIPVFVAFCKDAGASAGINDFDSGKAHKILAPKRELPQDRSVYSINGLPQCRFCGYKFTKWSGLQRHIQRNGCPILRHEDPATFAATAPATTNKAEDPLRTTQHAWVADSTIATTMPSTGDQPLVQDAQLQQDASKYTWTKVLHMWRTKHDFKNVCVFCGQWAVDASALKQHYAKQHQALTNPWIAAYRAECKQLAKVAVEMEDMPDFDAESQIQSLLGGLSSVVDLKPLLNPTSTPARNQSHLTNKRPRAEQWTRGTGSKGGGKGKGVASNGTLSQEDLQQLLRQIVVLLLRQGDQLNRLQTDTGYYLVFQVPGDATMVPVLIAGALEWRNQKKADPTKLTMSLRIALIGLFLKELQMRLEKIRANDQLQEKLKEQGLMTDEGAWTYRQWCPKNKALQLQLSRDPIKWDVLMTHITNALQGLNNQDHITRFQATKALEEGQMGPTLPFLLDISLKPSACRLHQSMRALVDCSAMEAVGHYAYLFYMATHTLVGTPTDSAAVPSLDFYEELYTVACRRIQLDNPLHSYLWQLPKWAALVSKHSFVTFDSLLLTSAMGQAGIVACVDKSVRCNLVAESSRRSFLNLLTPFQFAVLRLPLSIPSTAFRLPAGAKLLRESVERGGSRLPEGNKFYIFGVYRSMQAFLNEAKLVVHPFDSARSLPDELLRVLFDTLTKSPVDTMRHRLLKLQHRRALAKQLEPEEEKIRSAMDPCVRKVLGCKRIALMKRVAADLSWPDTALFDDLAAGFKLTGYLGRTGVFASDVKPATMDLDEFWASAPLRRETLLEKVRAQKDHDYAEELWNMTLEESNRSGKCWLDGPIDVDSLGDTFPEGWNACRRFAVWQGKWRAIDDFSEAAVNSCFGCFERVTLKALDEICWLCMQVCRAAKSSGSLDLELSSGERLKGPLHTAWKDADRVRPHCKTYDLQAAYKQLALHPGERPKSIILLREPGSRAVKAFVCNTLPFGTSASVMQFNRVALFLQRVLWDLRVAVTCYYDDFPTMTPSFLSGGTDNAVHALMDLFGFSLSEKEKPFSCTAETLGVVLDTSDPDMGRIFVSNKPERAAMLEESIGRILEQGQVDTRELPSLLGKLRFADAQLLGRTGRLALADLRLLGDKGGVLQLTDSQSNALAVLRARLLASRPRAIATSPPSNPVLIFTDGACDPCEGGFTSLFPARGQWAEGRKHIIGQVELYAVVLARILWSSYIGGERCIFFVDHSGVLSACINSNSIDASWRSLLLHLEAADEARPCLPWFHRVPSQSNIADPPSRGRWDELAFLGPFARDAPTCFVTGEALDAT